MIGRLIGVQWFIIKYTNFNIENVLVYLAKNCSSYKTFSAFGDSILKPILWCVQNSLWLLFAKSWLNS